MPTAPADFHALQPSVRGNFLFEGLGERELRTVFGLMHKTAVARGETVIRQGEQGDFFYVVLRGQFDAKKDGVARPVFSCSAGVIFSSSVYIGICMQ